MVAAGTVVVLVMVTLDAATLCGSVIDLVTVRVVVVVQNTVAGNEAVTTLRAGVTAAAAAATAALSWSGVPVVSERIGVKPGDVGIVVVPFVFVLVMVVRNSVRVVVTVKAVVYVGTAETLVLPSWVVQDLAWTVMGYLLWKSKRKERNEELCRNKIMAARRPL